MIDFPGLRPSSTRLDRCPPSTANISAGQVHHKPLHRAVWVFQNGANDCGSRCVLHPSTVKCWLHNTPRIQKYLYINPPCHAWLVCQAAEALPNVPSSLLNTDKLFSAASVQAHSTIVKSTGDISTGLNFESTLAPLPIAACHMRCVWYPLVLKMVGGGGSYQRGVCTHC